MAVKGGARGVVALQSSSQARSALPALPSPLVLPGEYVFCWGGSLAHGTDHVHLRLWVLAQGSQGVSGGCRGSRVRACCCHLVLDS